MGVRRKKKNRKKNDEQEKKRSGAGLLLAAAVALAYSHVVHANPFSKMWVLWLKELEKGCGEPSCCFCQCLSVG